jgi:hypothetical protein
MYSLGTKWKKIETGRGYLDLSNKKYSFCFKTFTVVCPNGYKSEWLTQYSRGVSSGALVLCIRWLAHPPGSYDRGVTDGANSAWDLFYSMTCFTSFLLQQCLFTQSCPFPWTAIHRKQNTVLTVGARGWGTDQVQLKQYRNLPTTAKNNPYKMPSLDLSHSIYPHVHSDQTAISWSYIAQVLSRNTLLYGSYQDNSLRSALS